MMKKTMIIVVVIMLVIVGLSGCLDSGVGENQSPTASIYADPKTGIAALTVYLLGSGEDTDGTIKSYQWDFGDGNTSTVQNPTHQYINPGTYVITLTITDDDGATGFETIEIIVEVPGENPEPFFVTPTDGSMMSGNTSLWVGDFLDSDIIYSEFFYSTDGFTWTLIDTDIDGSERTVGGLGVPATGWGDGWCGYWDVSDMDEGWYYIRAKMWKSAETFGYADMHVYVEPTPPTSTFIDLAYDDVVQGDVIMEISMSDEDIVELLLEIQDASSYYEKEVELKNQLHYCHNLSGKNLSTVCCGPTAAASCLKYWAEHGYPDIMKKKGTGDLITQSELVERLAELMKTDENGTADSDFVKGLRDYLNEVGWGCNNPFGLKVGVEENGYNDGIAGNNCSVERYKRELEANREDVLWGIVLNWNVTEKRYDGGHWMTGNSVNSTLVNDTDGDGLKEHQVDFMDPWGGAQLNVSMNTDGTYKHNGVWYYPDILVTVSEKNPLEDWDIIEEIQDPGDSWLASWDTTSVENGYYFIRTSELVFKSKTSRYSYPYGSND
jgi:PKD repeat protein